MVPYSFPPVGVAGTPIHILGLFGSQIVCKLEDRSPAEGPADRVALAIVNKLESQCVLGRFTPP